MSAVSARRFVPTGSQRWYMASRHGESRRRFLLTGAALGAAGLGAGCLSSQAADRALSFSTFDDALLEMERLHRLSPRSQSAQWNWAQTLVHCAQSIEFSLYGYPQARSALFQRTVGKAAFEVFAWRGRMSHDLSEPIPGAAALASEADPQASLQRLHAVVAEFRQHTGALQPHFAYNAL